MCKFNKQALPIFQRNKETAKRQLLCFLVRIHFSLVKICTRIIADVNIAGVAFCNAAFDDIRGKRKLVFGVINGSEKNVEARVIDHNNVVR